MNIQSIGGIALSSDWLTILLLFWTRTIPVGIQADAGLPCQGSSGEVLKDPRVQCWIENYRNLLDAWSFWHKRAEFDIHRSKLDPSSKPLAQVPCAVNPSTV